ncbi:MAG TPA: hypothetical protein DD438_13485 [Verrucomicrobiales bacterium]|nr:hypothetical protein [Roseibacillus sp.]HBM79115.1 hypothetical protein [Verrucomicrobiales bacterium]
MSKPEWIVCYEINRIEIDHTAQETEHHEINKPELHDHSEKGNPLVTEIPHYRVKSEKNRNERERKEDFGFGEVVHG